MAGSDQFRDQPGHAMSCDLEAGGVEDLRPDVAVQPDELEMRVLSDQPCGPGSHSPCQGQPELLVLMGRGDELVRVRLDADRDSDQRLGGDAQFDGQGSQPLDLGERVDDDAPDPDLQCPAQLGFALVVSVEQHARRIDTCPQRDLHLAAGADIDAQALLIGPLRDSPGQEGFRGVVHVGAGVGLGITAGGLAEVLLVQHEQGAAELRDRLGDGDACQGEHASHPLRVRRPDRCVEGVEVGGRVAVREGMADVLVPGSSRMCRHGIKGMGWLPRS